MFSGIVETMGNITRIIEENGCKHFTINPHVPFDDVRIGDSIAINGVCLTVTKLTEHSFDVTVVPETLRVTNLNELKENAEINLERSVKVNSRIGGHYVQGHVDGITIIDDITKDENSDALLVRFRTPLGLDKYIVRKGFVTLDGMSITVVDAIDNHFTVTFIPHTQNVTITKYYRKDTAVNLEVDILSKYVEKIAGGLTHAATN